LTVLAPKFENIPPELKVTSCVLWKLEARDGKPTKLPYQPNGSYAKSNDPGTWITYQAAVDAYERQYGKWAGIGIMLAGGGLCGVDLDHCIVDGQIESWAAQIVREVNSYTEISPSGSGLRIWIYSDEIPDKWRKRKDNREVYSITDNRFLTVTGHHVEGTPTTIRRIAIEDVHRIVLPWPGMRDDVPAAAPPRVTATPSLSEMEILDKAFASKNGAEIRQLYEGNTSGYASWSEAVPALLWRLAFWTKDKGKLDLLFRSSGLMADKWDRAQSGSTWGSLELDRAIANSTGDYSPTGTPTRAAVAGNGSTNVGTPPEGTGLDLTALAGVQPRAVSWLWKHRVPFGKISIQDGDPDKGKSTILLDLAARVSRGDVMPDGSPGVAGGGGVLLLMSEDDIEDTIRPRLDAAGADVSRIWALTEFDIPDQIPSLESEIIERGIRLVVFDPLVAYLGEKMSANSDKDVRRALKPLGDMAQRTGVAIIGNRHLNKNGGVGASAMYRGGASIAFVALARSAWMVGSMPDDDDTRYLALVKHNLAPKPPTLKYRIAITDTGLPYVSWEGESSVTANQLVGANGSASVADVSAVEEAAEFLIDLLGDGGIVPAESVKRQAESAGHSWATVRRAKDLAKVESVKESITGGWVWRAKPAPPQPHQA